MNKHRLPPFALHVRDAGASPVAGAWIVGSLFLAGGIVMIVGYIVARRSDVVDGALAAFFLYIPIQLAGILAPCIRLACCSAWLEGTVLVSRSFGGIRRFDLATAIVDVSSVVEYGYHPGYHIGDFHTIGHAYPIGRRPVLVVRNPSTGTSMSLSLWARGTRTLVSPPPLLALAWAIESGRRPEPYERRARQVVAGLRQIANTPFAGHL